MPSRAARYARATGTASSQFASGATQQAPGTDTGGTLFKMLTIAGLAGLFILHPQYVSLVFDNAVRLISIVIRGEPGGTANGTAPKQ